MSLIANGAGESGSANFYNGVTSSSLRANIGDSPGLRRTMLTGTSRRKFTFSAWVKRAGTFAATENLFAISPDPYLQFGWRSSGDGGGLQFSHYTGGFDFRVETSTKFRDQSAWYHLVARVDTTQGTDSNRVRLYVNGVVQTALAQNTYPSQDFDTVAGVADHRMYFAGGKADEGGGNVYNDSYMAEINFIDGQSLAPTSFGEFKNGTWIPIDTSGLTFGNNGTRLQFKNSGTATTSEATTATTNIGDDSSGNGHNFQTLGYVASDVVLDNPENNFCTINGTVKSTGTIAESEGNLRSTQSGTTSSFLFGTIPFRSGKWWMEVRVNAFNDNFAPCVIRPSNVPGDGSSTDLFSVAGSVGMYQNGQGFVDGSSVAHGTFAPSGHDGNDVGDVIGVAIDLDSGTPTIKFFLDGTQTSITQNLPASMLNTDLVFGCLQYNGNTLHFNWGQDSTFGGLETATTNADDNGIGEFHHAPPSGYLALCTANLPEPTIGPNSDTQADDHFNTVLYSGNGSNSHAITGVGFQPDWLWIKRRDGANSHVLMDSSRGSGSNDSLRVLISNATDVEYDLNDHVRSLDSDGFTLDDDTDNTVATNNNSQTYVAWNWKLNGGTTSTNSDGSANSTVQVDTKVGMSQVLYTGNASGAGAEQTIGHGLGVVPDVMLWKGRGNAQPWYMYHKNLGTPNDNHLYLNGTNAEVSTSNDYMNRVGPTDAVFSVGYEFATNKNAVAYITYCFKSIPGFSKYDKYTGNGNADGTFVYLGFRPAWVILKATSRTGNWIMYDNARDTFNTVDEGLFPNLSSAESTQSGGNIDFLSNGFKCRATGSAMNESSATYIYWAFAEVPFKYANAR